MHSIVLMGLKSEGTSQTGAEVGPTQIQTTEPSAVVFPVVELKPGALPPEVPGVVTCWINPPETIC